MKRAFASIFAGFLFVSPSLAGAQSVGVLHAGVDANHNTNAIASINAALSSGVRHGDELWTGLERYALPPPSVDALAPWRERAREARRAWARAIEAGANRDALAALETIETVLREFDAHPEMLDYFQDNRDAYRVSLLFLAERGTGARAEQAIRRLALWDPSLVLTARDASPSVQAAFTRTLTSLPRGSLRVEAELPNCVLFRSGREVGPLPFEQRDLPAGTHRLRVRCGALETWTRSVDVAAGATLRVSFDVQFDAVLQHGAGPELRYATEGVLRSRVAEDASRLGTLLSFQRAYVVVRDRVLVIDVAARRIVGEAALEDRAALLRLRTASGDEAPANPPPSVVVPVRPAPRGSPTVGIALLASGAAVVGAGVAFELLAQQAYNLALQTGEARTDTGALRAERERSVLGWRIGEGVAFGIGAGLMIGGIVALARPSPPTNAVVFRPGLGSLETVVHF